MSIDEITRGRAKRPLHKTKRARKTPENEALLEQFPNAGPHPNVTGMKNKYYGINALCVMCGPYLYNVTREIYDQF